MNATLHYKRQRARNEARKSASGAQIAAAAGFDVFLLLLASAGLPEPQREVSGLVPGRRFRVDYLFPAQKVVIERDGGVWMKRGNAKGHGSPAGILTGMERSNLLQIEGYKVLRFTPQQLDSGAVLPLLRRVLA